MVDKDKKTVLTLDAGGTSFVFSAIADNKEVVEPISYAAYPSDLKKCLNSMVAGFQQVMKKLGSGSKVFRLRPT